MPTYNYQPRSAAQRILDNLKIDEIMINTNTEEWEKEFDEATKNECQHFPNDFIKDHIRTHFIPRSEIRKVVEGLKKEIGDTEGLKPNGHHTNSVHRKIKYNQALTDLLNTLSLTEKEDGV